MIFEEAMEALARVEPRDLEDPLADLTLPGPEDLEAIRQGQHIGHQYHHVAGYLVDLVAAEQTRSRPRRLKAALRHLRGRPDRAAVDLDATDLGNATIDSLLRLEEAVWAAHGRAIDFGAAAPSWRDEALLAQFYASPWRLPEVEELGRAVVDPLTGESFVWPLERVLALQWRGEALGARQVYGDLPLTERARDSLRETAEALLDRNGGDCKALYMLLWADFAESLYMSHYDLEYHPDWRHYAEGRLAHRTLRRAYSDEAVEGLIALLFGAGYRPRGLSHLSPWQRVWDHVGALISREPLMPRDWPEKEDEGLPKAA